MPTVRQGFAFPFEELRDEIDRVWTTLSGSPSPFGSTLTDSIQRSSGPRFDWPTRAAGGAGYPAVNIAEQDDAVTIEAELPGLGEADVEISVTGDELLLKGMRPDVCPMTSTSVASKGGNGEKGGGERVTWHRRERSTGGFERRIVLPVAVDATRVEARLVDGVLTITCPKAAESKPHKVQVRSA
ncbi:MAG: Hsp20/alpha crystallin family protein [Pirellulales bacterium]